MYLISEVLSTAPFWVSTNISADGNTSSSSCQMQLHISHNFDLYQTWKYSNSLARLSLAASLDFSFLSSAGLERFILGSFPERQRLVGCLPSERQTSKEPQGASTATMHIFRQMPCGVLASIACWPFCLIFCQDISQLLNAGLCILKLVYESCALT